MNATLFDDSRPILASRPRKGDLEKEPPSVPEGGREPPVDPDGDFVPEKAPDQPGTPMPNPRNPNPRQ